MLLIVQPYKLVRDPLGHGSIKGGKDVAGEKGEGCSRRKGGAQFLGNL